MRSSVRPECSYHVVCGGILKKRPVAEWWKARSGSTLARRVGRFNNGDLRGQILKPKFVTILLTPRSTMQNDTLCAFSTFLESRNNLTHNLKDNFLRVVNNRPDARST